MTTTELLELIRAGYTKADIEALEKPVEPKPEPKPEPEQPKPEEPKKEPEQGNNEVLAAINNLTKAIQMQNLQKIGLDTPGDMTAEQALAAGVWGNMIGGKK